MTGTGTRLDRRRDDARLILQTEDAAPVLGALAAYRRPGMTRRGIAAAAGLVLGMAALWQGGPLLADGAAMLVPESAARVLGRVAVQQVAAGGRFCAAAPGQAALQRLTARLSEAAGLAEVPEVSVVDQPQVNAFAVPGNRILPLRGLLARARDAEEVAGVLAHEVGHLPRDHPLRGLTRAVGLGVLTAALTGGSDVAALGATLLNLASSRAFEAEADAEAVRILTAAGIGSGGLGRFFERAEADGAGDATLYLAGHPPGADRLAAIPRTGRAGPAMSAEEWAALRRIC